jgi:spermidine dehydrogenase
LRVRRRDFLNGVALTVGAGLLSPRELLAGAPYPPALTGLRGSHDGSYEDAHRLRDPGFWDTAGEPRATGEVYDLVVVGAGLSGLAAAYWFRKATGPRTRILVLDNHDDFGGHARRNEISWRGRTVIGYGGSYAIESPAPYSDVAQGLVRELGIDVASWPKHHDGALYPALGLKPAVFLDRETFGGQDRLLSWPGGDAGGEGGDEPAEPGGWEAFVAAAALGDEAGKALLRLATGRVDYLPGLTVAEKRARLARTSYADYLRGPVGQPEVVIRLLQQRTHTLYGVGIDGVPAQDAWGLGMPGFAGLGLDDRPGPGMNRDSIPAPDAAPYFFHFPDGNATLARLMVRALVPGAVPGRDAGDVVRARADYGRLDRAANATRIRLRSTVARVRHAGPAESAPEVEVAYLRRGRMEQVRAGRVVLACWHAVIPHLCPELPAAQKEALAFAIKVPIVYTNVLVRDWSAFTRLGVRQVHAPSGYHCSFNLDLPVSVGGYRPARRADEPVMVHMVRTPCRPGLPARDQHRAGRVELLGTPFAAFEREIRGQLGRVLGPGGFDAGRDIAGITVNRWPHGYAYQYNSLFDPFWLEGGETPCERARRPFGRVAIANADAAAYSYADAALDEAHRAVREVLGMSAAGRVDMGA